MVAYTLTPGDLEMGAQDKTVVLVQKNSSLSWIWKLAVALFFVALCLGAVFVVVWMWSGKAEAMVQSGQREPQMTETPDEKTDPHSSLKPFSSKAKAAIHLEGTCEDNAKLEWQSEQGQAFLQGGFKLTDNKIVIPHTGLYFVYSQASFRVSCNDEDSSNSRRKPLSHRIWRFSESIGNPTSMMSTVRSACSQSAAQVDGSKGGQGWYNAIYLGAVFHLHKGDTLWTETNQLLELETDDGKTFFGVFAL